MDALQNKLDSLNLELLNEYALFISKSSNDLLVSPQVEVYKLENKHKKVLEKIGRNETLPCFRVLNNTISQISQEFALKDLYFTMIMSNNMKATISVLDSPAPDSK